MQKQLTSMVLGVLVVVSASAFADVRNSTIQNESTNQRTVNVAKGGFLGSATANTGSVHVKGDVRNSTLTNRSTNQNTVNQAEGGFLGSATANTGSLMIE